MPLITVLIVTHNRPALLEKAVESVLDQNFTDYELVIVGNRLMEENKQHLLMIAKKSEKIFVFFLDHKTGAAASRNFGLAQSKGKLIAFLDDDDIWCREKLEKQVSRFNERPELGLSYTYGYLVDGDNDRIIIPEEDTEDTFSGLLRKCLVYSTSFAMVRRDIFDTVGFFDETLELGQDYDLWLRIAFRYPIESLREPLALYVRHEGNVSKKYTKRHLSHIKMFKKWVCRPDLSTECRKIARERLATAYFSLGVELSDEGNEFGAAISFVLAGLNEPNIIRSTNYKSSRFTFINSMRVFGIAGKCFYRGMWNLCQVKRKAAPVLVPLDNNDLHTRETRIWNPVK